MRNFDPFHTYDDLGGVAESDLFIVTVSKQASRVVGDVRFPHFTIFNF